MDNLIKTGYTNSYPINPPRAWCTGCPNISIPYSINLGQLLAMVQDQHRTSLDILLAPTKYQSTYGVFTVRIRRWSLDSKDSSGADIPFGVTMDGNDLYWAELQAIKDYRVLGLYLAAKMPCCKSMEPKVLQTKAFPTNQ